VPLASLWNLRDLGGWPTREGSEVRRGFVFRSAGLQMLSPGDAAALENLGIRTVFDLRTQAEIVAQPDRLPAEVEYVGLDILADATGAGPARLMGALGDPAAARDMLADGRAERMFIDGYRSIVSLPSARSGYRRLFSDLTAPAKTPALFHCTTGKDRTGWAAAALLMLAGVSDDDVMSEYLLTNEQLVPQLGPMLAVFEAAGGDRDLLLPIVGVQPKYLNAALDEMRFRFGTIDGYFTEGLEMDAAAQDTLRSTLVQ
jgi:protein-tyrosine phosphatase